MAVRVGINGFGRIGRNIMRAALGDKNIDRRVDVYAVGCVAYFLLTGVRVFEAASPMKLLMQHVQAEPIRPSLRAEQHIPRDIDDFVMACLNKDPNQRPSSAEELLDMVSDCRTVDTWDQRSAKSWWEMHLPQLTTTVTLSERASEPGLTTRAKC